MAAYLDEKFNALIQDWLKESLEDSSEGGAKITPSERENLVEKFDKFFQPSDVALKDYRADIWQITGQDSYYYVGQQGQLKTYDYSYQSFVKWALLKSISKRPLDILPEDLQSFSFELKTEAMTKSVAEPILALSNSNWSISINTSTRNVEAQHHGVPAVLTQQALITIYDLYKNKVSLYDPRQYSWNQIDAKIESGCIDFQCVDEPNYRGFWENSTTIFIAESEYHRLSKESYYQPYLERSLSLPISQIANIDAYLKQLSTELKGMGVIVSEKDLKKDVKTLFTTKLDDFFKNDPFENERHLKKIADFVGLSPREFATRLNTAQKQQALTVFQDLKKELDKNQSLTLADIEKMHATLNGLKKRFPEELRQETVPNIQDLYQSYYQRLIKRLAVFYNLPEAQEALAVARKMGDQKWADATSAITGFILKKTQQAFDSLQPVYSASDLLTLKPLLKLDAIDQDGLQNVITRGGTILLKDKTLAPDLKRNYEDALDLLKSFSNEF